MQGRVVELRQVQLQAYSFNGLVDDASFEREFIGDLFMNTDRRYRKIWLVGSFNFRQFLAVAFIDLCFPPARNVIAIAEILDDFLDRLLGNGEFCGNLRANPIKLLGSRQFLVASLNLGNLFWRWHKRRGRRNLLAFWFWRSWRLRGFRSGWIASFPGVGTRLV